MEQDIIAKLEQRLGRVHTSQRLGIEKDYEQRVFGGGINFVHIENWYSIHSIIRNALKLIGLYWRGCRNAEQIRVRRNLVQRADVPTLFDGFAILHLSDMHADISQGAVRRLVELLGEVTYDLCVLTGDYRGKTFGPFEEALEAMAHVRSHLKGPVSAWFPDWRKLGVLRGLEALQEVKATFQDKRFLLRSQLTGEASAALRATGVAAPPTLRELP